MPALLVLGASIALRRGSEAREILLEDFYLSYMKNALQAGEFLERIFIPLPADNLIVQSYKLSKRYDQDISAVCAAFAVSLDEDKIQSAKVAFGGMAAIPKRAPKCEAALAGKPWNEHTIGLAMDALDLDYTPIDDMRASATYRKTVARNLLKRFFVETHSDNEQTNVYHFEK